MTGSELYTSVLSDILSRVYLDIEEARMFLSVLGREVGLLFKVLLKLMAPRSTRPRMARLDSSPKMMNRKARA